MTIEKYKIVFTPTSLQQIKEIYEYINQNLHEDIAAKRLMREIEIKIQQLKYTPRIYIKLQRHSDLNKEYRRMIINNFAVLYTIEDERNIVYISHIFYSGSNYLDKI